MSPILRWGLRGLLELLLTAAGVACAGTAVEQRTPYAIYVSSAPVEKETKYVIQPGDQLEIQFFYTPERNVIVPVRPDGFISLPLANEVRAAGQTAEELRETITASFEQGLASPEIAVIVRTFSDYKIHVGGEVKSPGVFLLSGRRTVLQALFEAGGNLPSASLSDVIVIRPKGEGSFAVIPVDLEAVLDGSDTRQNIALGPYDVVFVPKSAIANVNKWVDQYLRQNLPFSIGWELQF